MVAITRGRCACGAVTYTATGAPVVSVNCHCDDCRRESGSGHGAYLTFRQDQVSMQGKTATWSSPGDSGQAKHRHFCPACGTLISLTFDRGPDFIAIRAGTLDDDSAYAPDIVTYAARAIAADPVVAGIPAFAGMPPG